MIDILIVDDNAQIREALRMELQAQGKVRIVGEVSDGIAELLRGLESTARIVATLGLPDNAPEIETDEAAHMMSSFREQRTMIRDSVQDIAELADEANLAKSKKVTAAVINPMKVR